MPDFPIKKNVARTFYIPGLISQSNTKIFQVNPTIAVSDFKYSIDGGTLTNPATLPDVFPAGGTQIRIQLAQAELNGDQINIRWLDAAGAEWCDGAMTIFTSTLQTADAPTDSAGTTSLLTRIPAALTPNGNLKASLVEIITTALSEGAAGRIAAAWQAFWNVTSPVATAQSVNQTVDNATVWNRLTSALTTSGSIGKLIVDMLNATVGSRATPDDVDVTVAVSSTEAAVIATGRLAISAGYTFRQTITSTSTDDLSAATKLWLSIKLNSSLADSASQIFIEKTAGLTVVAGATYATVAHGSLTVSGSVGAWTIDIYIHDIATALLFGIGSDLRVAGLKYTKAGAAGDDLSAWDGSAVITDGIVRAVS